MRATRLPTVQRAPCLQFLPWLQYFSASVKHSVQLACASSGATLRKRPPSVNSASATSLPSPVPGR